MRTQCCASATHDGDSMAPLPGMPHRLHGRLNIAPVRCAGIQSVAVQRQRDHTCMPLSLQSTLRYDMPHIDKGESRGAAHLRHKQCTCCNLHERATARWHICMYFVSPAETMMAPWSEPDSHQACLPAGCLSHSKITPFSVLRANSDCMYIQAGGSPPRCPVQ
jgi:hypothetical protein